MAQDAFLRVAAFFFAPTARFGAAGFAVLAGFDFAGLGAAKSLATGISTASFQRFSNP